MTFPQRLTQLSWWIIRFIQLQLFITLFSLPILIYWGLPFSLLSPLGNLIFGPVLTLFLFLSSLIFFTELLWLPNQWFIYALEKVTYWWLIFMPADNQRWLIGFAQPSSLLLFFIVIITIGIMVIRKTASLKMSIICFTALFLFFGLSLQYGSKQYSPTLKTLSCNKGALTFIASNKECIMIDPGYLGQRISANSWIQYTLIPYVIKELGRTTIDHCIILHPSGLVFQALERLCTKMKVKNIYLVYWFGDMSSHALRDYGKFKRAALAHDTCIIRLGSQSLTIGNNACITLERLASTIGYQTISYPAFACHTQIDNKDITIYSAKYINKNRAISHKNQSPKADE